MAYIFNIIYRFINLNKMVDKMPDEFSEITKPLIKEMWEEGYFTIPLPGKGKKEFRLDMPAFERFDVIAMKWDGEELKVNGIECKIRAKDAIPQARTYQLCIPDVYIASREKISKELAEKLNQYGIGYIEVSKDTIKTVLESRRSFLFNKRFYENEVLPRLTTILIFYDYMEKCLGIDREKILEKIDLGIQREYLWISNIRASDNVQWSMTYNGSTKTMRFGINLESVKVIRKTFHNKSREEVLTFFKKLKKQLPGNFIIKFENRCPGYPERRMFPGISHQPFNELGVSQKRVLELSENDINFMAEKIRSYEYIEFGIWIEICKEREIQSWTRKDLLRKIKYYKEKYLQEIYNILIENNELNITE